MRKTKDRFMNWISRCSRTGKAPILMFYEYM